MQLILSAVSSIVQKQLFTNDASRNQWVRGYLLAGNQRIFITLIFTISLEFYILSYKIQFFKFPKFIAQKMSRFYCKCFCFRDQTISPNISYYAIIKKLAFFNFFNGLSSFASNMLLKNIILLQQRKQKTDFKHCH